MRQNALKRTVIINTVGRITDSPEMYIFIGSPEANATPYNKSICLKVLQRIKYQENKYLPTNESSRWGNTRTIRYDRLLFHYFYNTFTFFFHHFTAV